MAKTSKIKLVRAAILLMLLTGCAIRKGPPEGGPRDETPPKVLSESPNNGSVNFKEKRIVISFDEFVELNNAFREIQITPTTAKAPTMYLSKRSLYIDTAGLQLKSNTTYTIQFGNGIRDINEGNTLLGYQYIFSTGPYLDSLSIDGNLASIDPIQKLEKVRIHLYPEGNDTGLYKGRPSYMTLADESGYFKIQNLPKGRFKLYAVEDKNDNFTLDRGERVGFVPGMLNLDSAVRLDTALVVFLPSPQKFKFTTAIATPSVLHLKVNMPVDSIHISEAGFPDWNQAKDSLNFWFPQSTNREIKITAISGVYRADTTVRPVVNPKDTSHTMFLVMDQSADNPVKYGFPFLLRFTEPIGRIDYKKIYFTAEDSTPLTGLKFRFIDSSHLNMAAVYPFEENARYRVAIGRGAFTSIRGRTQDSSVGMFSAPSRRDFGLLQISVLPPHPGVQYIFELVNSSGQAIYSRIIPAAEVINLPYVQPGNYRLRLIEDVNRNGRWDTGNLDRETQPERIIYHNQEITARANWEMAGIIFTP